MPSVRAHVPWAALVAALALLYSAGHMVVDLRDEVRRAQQRAATAEAELATATAEAGRAFAVLATSTAAPQARVMEARRTLEQALAATLEALRQPTPDRMAHLSSFYARQPLAEVRPELDYLAAGGLHLGGRSTYELDVREAEPLGAERVLIRTQERWTYDEHDADERTARCLQERYSVTYVLAPQDDQWHIEDLHLDEPTQRSAC